MTVAGDVTSEDRQWSSAFIENNFKAHYINLLGGNIPSDSPNWHSLFHSEWTADLPNNEIYDKALWLRREKALLLELKAAYARFLGLNPPEDDIE